MTKIAIVTDSTCDLPQEVVEEYGINILPLQILYKDQHYRDNVDITAQEVYDRLKTEVPSTSLPVPQDVENLFEKLKSEGFSHVIAIHISSGLSGTSQMIENMAEQAKGIAVKVIDSKSISMGLGFTVLEAARKLRENADFDGVCQHVQSVIKRMKVFFVLDTLEYLIKGGRIGKVAGTLGQILNVKPIITVNPEGIYTTFAKVRGRKQSIVKLAEIAKEHIDKALSNVGVAHGGAPKDAENIIEQIKGSKNIKEMFAGQVSPVIGVHTGPGTIGVVFYHVD